MSDSENTEDKRHCVSQPTATNSSVALAKSVSSQVVPPIGASMQSCQQGNIVVNFRYAKNVYFQCGSCGVRHQVASDSVCTLSELDKIFLDKRKWLRYRYKRNEMPSHLWDDSSKDLPLDKCFIPLTVDEDHWRGKTPTGESIRLDEIFTAADSSGQYRKERILIRAKPGYGKSTLIKRIAYDWAKRKEPHYLDMFDIVMIIPLIKLKDMTIEEAIITEIATGDKETLIPELHNTKLKFLLLLDGFDEAVNKEKIIQFLSSEKEVEFFFNVTVIVTSRPQAADTIWGQFDRHLSISGFSEENKEKYINEVLGHKKDIKDKLLEKLKENSFLSDLSECPLMIHMFCVLESETSTATALNINTLTGLYTELLRLLIARCCRKHGNQDTAKEGDVFLKQDLIFKLGSLAYRFFEQDINNLPVTTLSKDMLCEVFSDEDLEFITDLDFLVCGDASTDRENTCAYYDFTHQTIAEFLTVFYIVKLSECDQKLKFTKLFYPSNDLFIICFFFGLMKETILESKQRFILQRFSDKYWEADWIEKFKNEISHETWDKLFARQFIKKLSCGTHNLRRDAAWFPLHSYLQEMTVTVNLGRHFWEEVVEVIRSCEYLTSLTISICSYSQLQVTSSDIGTALRINISFLMDDLIELSSLSLLKKFFINIEDVSVDIASTSDSTLSTHVEGLSVSESQIFRLRPNQLKKEKNNFQVAFWNIGKMEITVTFTQVAGESNSTDFHDVMLLISESQYKLLKPFIPEQCMVIEHLCQ